MLQYMEGNLSEARAWFSTVVINYKASNLLNATRRYLFYYERSLIGSSVAERTGLLVDPRNRSIPFISAGIHQLKSKNERQDGSHTRIRIINHLIFFFLSHSCS